MKIGMLVGAVGLALAGAAQADRGTTVRAQMLHMSDTQQLSVFAPETDPSAPRISPEQWEEIRKERLQAIGRPGSARFKATVDSIKDQIDKGLINPRTVLLDSTQWLEAEVDPSHAPITPAIGEPGANFFDSSRGVDPDPPFDYWDGMETYTLEPDPSDNTFTNGMNAQVGCGGITAVASFYFVAVDEANPLNNPQILDSSRDPFMGGALPCTDVSPGVQAVMMDGRGSRGVRITGTFLGYRLRTGDQGAPAAPLIFEARADAPYISIVDYYFGDQEQYDCQSPSSTFQGFITSRVCMSGYSQGDPFAEGPFDATLRPQFLGTLPGNFTIGQFLATPVDPAVGLPTLKTKTGEWFSVATRCSTNQLEWWWKDSGTDGSDAILIDDPGDVPLFESGWARVFPGRDPGTPTPLRGVTTWEGYGFCVDQFGDPADDPAPVPAGQTCDNTFSIVGGDPDPVMFPDLPRPGWVPTNHFMDNWIVIGETLEVPAQPKARIPYKDDIERYVGGSLLAFQGTTWTDNLSSRAVIAVGSSTNTTLPPGSDGDGMPMQSILQENVLEDSFMREEFQSNTPIDPWRPQAQPGAPVVVQCNIGLTNTTTARAFLATDAAADGSTEFLLLGATGANDLTDPRAHIRLPNPLFDDTMPTSSIARVDDVPDLADNPLNINYPTTFNFLGLVGPPGSFDFMTCVLTLHGDGTAEWSINGTTLVFDAAFYSMDPALEQELIDASLLHGGTGTAPYTVFLSPQRTLDQVNYWSGNNRGGFFDGLYVDDVCIDADIRNPGPGPLFELPYCDDFECYNLDEGLSDQGDTPFVSAASVNDANLNLEDRALLASNSTASFPANTLWCCYTVQELIPAVDRKGNVLPDEWGVEVGDLIYVQKPAGEPGFVCPDPADNVGRANFVLLDPAETDPLTPCFVRVGSPTDIMSSGAEADFRTTNDRYDPATLFCRYQLKTAFTGEPDPSMGGDPFTCPNWAVNSFIAVDQLFAVGDDGVSGCPGDLMADTAVALFDNMECVTCTATWRLVSSVVPMGGGDPVGGAVPAVAGDIRNVGLDSDPISIWTDLINATFAAGGSGGDGWVRNGQDEMDDVLAASIDAAGEFGQVGAFINNNSNADDQASLRFSGIALLPSAAANASDQPNPGDPSNDVIGAWDVYVQDTNTRNVYRLEGDNDNGPMGGGIAVSVRLGGTDTFDGVASNEIAVEVPNPVMGGFPPPPAFIWQSTGIQVVTGQWVRVRARIDVDGNFSLGMNTVGDPMGPGDDTVDGNFDDTAMGAHANAVLIATGVSRDTDPDTGAPINTIDTFSVLQGFDDEGDGVASLGAVTVISKGEAAARPGGLGRFDFCFYQVSSVDAGATGPMIAPVDILTGDVIDDNPPAGFDGDQRIISANDNDIIAVAFNAGMGVTSIDTCPPNGMFEFEDGGMTALSTGTWFLTGRPDIETSALPPRGGIQNADGIVDGDAYNFGVLGGYPLPLPGPSNPTPPPYRNILLANFVEIPTLPEPELNSKWWIDNFKLQLLPGVVFIPCPWDLNGDGMVGSSDVAFLLGSWGPVVPPGPPFDPADFNEDNNVNSGDLAQMLGAWGPCPM